MRRGVVWTLALPIWMDVQLQVNERAESCSSHQYCGGQVNKNYKRFMARKQNSVGAKLFADVTLISRSRSWVAAAGSESQRFVVDKNPIEILIFFFSVPFQASCKL